MSSTKHWLTPFAVALATLVSVQAHYVTDHTQQDIKFYELKKGNLCVNFTNIGARIVSIYVPDKFGKVSDIVLGYDSVDAYKKDAYSLGAVVNVERNADRSNGGQFDFGNVVWKMTNLDKSTKRPSISFQVSISDSEQGFPGNLIVTATYLLQAKNKLRLTVCSESKDEARATPVNLAHNIYWNLGGHNNTGNILHDQLRVLASNYTRLDPTGRALPVRDTPYDFQRPHAIQSRYQKLKDGYEVRYVLDQVGKKDREVKMVAILRDNRSGRLMKVWTDQPVVHFSTAHKLRNVRGKHGVLLSPQGYQYSDIFPTKIVSNQKPYKQTTVFQFLIKK